MAEGCRLPLSSILSPRRGGLERNALGVVRLGWCCAYETAGEAGGLREILRGRRRVSRARWWVRSWSKSGLALGTLGFAAGLKVARRSRAPGSLVGFGVEPVGARPRISWLRRWTKGREALQGGRGLADEGHGGGGGEVVEGDDGVVDDYGAHEFAGKAQHGGATSEDEG